MDYEMFYDFVVREIKRLKQSDVSENYSLCKALAACYELQDYLANRLGEMVEQGEMEDY